MGKPGNGVDTRLPAGHVSASWEGMRLENHLETGRLDVLTPDKCDTAGAAKQVYGESRLYYGRHPQEDLWHCYHDHICTIILTWLTEDSPKVPYCNVGVTEEWTPGDTDLYLWKQSQGIPGEQGVGSEIQGSCPSHIDD